jgi:hypothetical protein
MGCPGAGALCGRGTPGLIGRPGAEGAGMPGAAARGWLNLATRSARGSTTGRAAGWPASGRAGCLGAACKGVLGAPGGTEPPADAGADGARAATPGLLNIGADGESGSLRPGGIGWRGPESTWPGRGGGTGLGAGATGRPGPSAGAAGGCRGATRTGCCAPGGALPANGGRMGCAGRPAGRSSATSPAAGSVVLSSMAAGAWTGGPPGATSGAGEVSTAAGACSGGAAGRATGSASTSGAAPPNIRRSLTATSSSTELEWVFFSVTPNPGSRSRISCALTSNSRASSLIRILFIDTKLSRQGAPHSFCELPASDSS